MHLLTYLFQNNETFSFYNTIQVLSLRFRLGQLWINEKVFWYCFSLQIVKHKFSNLDVVLQDTVRFWIVWINKCIMVI